MKLGNIMKIVAFIHAARGAGQVTAFFCWRYFGRVPPCRLPRCVSIAAKQIARKNLRSAERERVHEPESKFLTNFKPFFKTICEKFRE